MADDYSARCPRRPALAGLEAQALDATAIKESWAGASARRRDASEPVRLGFRDVLAVVTTRRRSAARPPISSDPSLSPISSAVALQYFKDNCPDRERSGVEVLTQSARYHGGAGVSSATIAAGARSSVDFRSSR